MGDLIKGKKKYKRSGNEITDPQSVMEEYMYLDSYVENDLEELSLSDTEKLGADITGLKDKLLSLIKNDQIKVSQVLKTKIEIERQARIKQDPDYFKKIQNAM